MGPSKVNPVTVDTLIDQFEFDKTTFEYASGYHVDNHEDDTLIDEALKIIKKQRQSHFIGWSNRFI